MSFLSHNNMYIKFVEKPEKLIQRFYGTIRALPTTSKIEFINKKEFANTALDRNFETFVIYIVILGAEKLLYLLCKNRLTSSTSWPTQRGRCSA